MKKIILTFLGFLESLIMSAQIIYTDIIPDNNYQCSYVTPQSLFGSCSNYYNVDINHDGIMDFKFSYEASANQYMGSTSDYLIVNNNNYISYKAVDLPFSLGDTIDSNSNWVSNVYFFGSSYLTGGSSSSGGSWPLDVNDYYLGVKLSVGTNTYYGWIRRGWGILRDYAYELSENYIIAGQKPADCDTCNNNEKNLKFELSPNPATNKIIIRPNFREAGMISIISITGEQILLRTYVFQDWIEIDIALLSKGMYFIKLTTTEGSQVGKFVKE